MMLNKIIKRDGREVKFELSKLTAAILKAGRGTGEFKRGEAKRLAEIVVQLVLKTHGGKKIVQVEELQDIVEQVLMAAGHFESAKAYILYREKRSEVRRMERLIGVRDDLGLNLNQLRIMENRYLLKDENGKVIETPKELFERVAKNLVKAERKYKISKTKRRKLEEEFYEVMATMRFVPAGRTLNNAGTPQNQLANCFVLPVEDSMEAIFEAVKWTALVQQTGGGTGFNFSHLRPKGDVVTKSSGGFATGPVSFMKVFDAATAQVMQGGKKRGANMGILNVDHPDILEFISCKSEGGEVENFNISVGITDKFMKAVEKDKDWDLINPRTGEVVSTIKARSLMSQIVAMAWRTGDPGVIFLDEINRNNPLLAKYGPIEATNPCGEQPLHPFDACNLGSINLAKFVKDGDTVTRWHKKIDWEDLRKTIRVAVRMLDNVIDVSKYPLSQISKTVRANRRIGLGVMGWADMLYQLRIQYDSKEAVKLAEKISKFIFEVSWEMSEELAKEKGVFPRWSESDFARGTARACKNGKPRKVRNVAITTIAPTGSISMLADASSGIEPIFALSYVKNVVTDEGLNYVNKYFQKELEQASWADGDPEHKVRDRIVRDVARTGSLAEVSGVPREIKEVYRTAHDISPEWHIKMQAAWQKWIDNAVSKTVNFANEATIDDVWKAYMLAWKLKCKGTTIYRDGSKDFQILSVGNEKKSKGEKQLIQSKIKIKPLKKTKGKMTVCPECGGKLVIEEGCSKCYSCGFSVCNG